MTSLNHERQSNIELLRILSMIIIVFHHFAVHGGFSWGASVSIPLFWYNLLRMGGKIGVNAFVLISGYFLITDKGSLFNLKRLLKFWGQVIFYSVSIFVIFSLLRGNDYGFKTLIYSVLPITFSSWWFASTYFVLYVIHPFLNMFLNGLSKKDYQKLILMLVFLWSVIPTFTTVRFQSNDLCWFVTMYAIAGYVRLYGFNTKLTTKGWFALWGIFSILTYLTSVVFTILGTKWEVFFVHATWFFDMQRIPGLLISLTLFMSFATLKIKYHKWINILGSATFGVYLIHDNILVRPFLWKEVFQNSKYQDSLMLIPYSIFAVALVYAVCTVIDIIRQKVIEKPFMLVVNRYADSMLKPFIKIYNLLRTTVFG